jgi:hypothetical protein
MFQAVEVANDLADKPTADLSRQDIGGQSGRGLRGCKGGTENGESECWTQHDF